MNTLEPRKVEAGAVKRWLGEASELMTRRFLLWLLATVLFLTFCLMLSPSVLFLNVIALVVMGSVSLGGGVYLAAYADQRISRRTLLRPGAMVWSWRYLVRTFPKVVRHNVVTIIFGFLAQIVAFTITRSGDLFLPDSTSAGSLFVLPLVVFYVSFGSLLTQNLFMNQHPSTHIHRLLATTLLELSWDESEILVLRGYSLNVGVLWPLSGGPHSLLVALVVFLLALIPVAGTFVVAVGFVLLPLVSCFYYVSFRDIYLGVAENASVPERQTKSLAEVARETA